MAKDFRQRERKPGGPPPALESFHARVPPHSLEAEQSVLGGIMLENRALYTVGGLVAPSDFYVEAHRIIFEAILDLSRVNQPIDILTVGEHLKGKGLLESVGGYAYLAGLQDAVPASANLDAHARLIKEKASVRACIGASYEILSKAYGDYGEAAQFLDDAEQRIFSATHHRALKDVIPIKKAINDAFEQIDKLSTMKTSITGVPTGYRKLDSVTCGLQGSDLVIIAGRPSMGKTAFALNIAVNAWRCGAVPSVIFSLEMSIDQLVRRLLASEGGIEAQKLKIPGKLTKDDFRRLTQTADYLQKAAMFFDDSAELNVMEIRSRARRLKEEQNIGLIVIDYLQILRPATVSKNDNREREVAEMSRQLKALAKELGVPVVALSQLNRRPEAREKNKEPQLSDLRESGAIEQDADLVLFIHRDAAYDKEIPEEDPRSREAKVIVGKNRNGPTPVLRLEFVKELTRFNDPDAETFAGDETDVGGVDFNE